MKIILSRKGFDSAAGRRPSPIFPDGRMISFPIPDKSTDMKYTEVQTHLGCSIGELMMQLGIEAKKANYFCHLDPDVYPWALNRKAGWLPLLGQENAAQTHLNHHGVAVGDIFLFFGWFRPVEIEANKWSYAQGGEMDQHVIFSYFQVGEILKVGPATNLPEFAKYHAHANDEHRGAKNNTLYIASKTLSFAKDLPGAGPLLHNDKTLLTKPGSLRSIWQLDEKIFRHVPISYHRDESWQPDGFKAASRGQEFVIDATDEIENWAQDLILKSVA